jgi:5'-3' exonuclease
MPKAETLLIDMASLVFRALFSTPDSVTAPDGTPINAAHGFLGMLARLVADHDPDFICCADDWDWRPQWRVDLLPMYKSMRAEEGSAQEVAEDRLAPQLPVLEQLLEQCAVPIVGYDGAEAEDVIGTLAQRAPGPVAIVSGDRDLFQLVRDPDIVVLYPKKGVSQMDTIDEGYIEQRYNIPGRTYRDFATLRGDPSDGLPGVKGIGEKMASALLQKYGGLEAVIAAAEAGESNSAIAKVRRDLDYLKAAMQVSTITTDLPIGNVDLARPRRTPDPTAYELAEKHGLKGALSRLVAALTGSTQEA